MDKLDILQRDEFVKQLERMIENISANKSSTCFAINGKWGCGKTFVLDMLQEKLEAKQNEETADNEYFVIRYNSWKFDYYREPLIAIVAEIVSVIEEKTALFPDSEEKQKLLGALQGICIVLLTCFGNVINAQTGFDVNSAVKTVFKGKEKGEGDYKKAHNYDEYFALKNSIEKLNELLKDLSEKYTIVFLVDELDRCMPEYAIKVLERLHHLTEGKSNIITVISIDKDQLKKSVEKIFGIDNSDKYLEKFIQFEVKLDYGNISESILDKYADYVALFDKDIFPFDEPVEECLQAIFKDVDIRTQEQVVHKAMVAHKLLYSGKKDYSFMCMELLLSVMICVYEDESCFNGTMINVSSFDNIFPGLKKDNQPPFIVFFKEKLNRTNFKHSRNFPGDYISHLLPDSPSLYGAIIYTWYWMHKSELSTDVVQWREGSINKVISKNYEELKKFAEMIKMMS